MDRKMLRKLRKLYPTRSMMEKAGQDVPGHRIVYRGRDTEVYKYGIYIRCQVLGGIMKATFFLAHQMRLGIREPVYEVFINKEGGEFITWDTGAEKWRTAKVDMLDWPEYTWHSGRYINPEGYRNIKKHLGTRHGGYKGILEYQQSVRNKELEERYRRETVSWDLAMDRIHPLPKDWEQWADRNGMLQHYMFYDYQRKEENTGYCTGCGKDLPIRHPRHNHYGVCPGCGRRVQYKARGKAGSFHTDREYAYLIQRCEGGFVIREFMLSRYYRRGDYGNPERTFKEVYRAIYNERMHEEVYYYGLYRNRYERWVKKSGSWDYYRYYMYRIKGMVYKRTLPALRRNELKRTGLVEFILGNTKTNPAEYLHGLRRMPWLEQLSKAGLARLAQDILRDDTVGKGELKNIFRPGKDLAKSLQIDRARMKRLRENNGGAVFLGWLVQEKEEDTVYDDRDLAYLDRKAVRCEDMKQLRSRMGMKEACNYLRRQEPLAAAHGIMEAGQVISMYGDYLSLAARLKMDTQQEIVYKPKNLKEAHDRAVALCGGKDVARRAAQIAEKFPDTDRICMEIREKYEYAGKKYLIRVPERIEDIIREGEILGHCLHSSDRYFDRISTRESYIVFLRKAEEPDRPWYTLEIEPDGTARQKRTTGDRQDADLEEAKNFIRRWQQEVQKRLTEEDRKLAEKSGFLRRREFEELRKEKKKVWHGSLAGKLLVDVLEADLMEAERAAVS